MCDLATNWSNTSVGVRNDIPTSGLVLNATSKVDDRKAGDKGQKKNVNAKDIKHDTKFECWNCGCNHFARDCANERLMLRSEIIMMMIMMMELYLTVLKIAFQSILRIMMIMKI